MQTNYRYWRAAHPLIYIGLHLLIGHWIANYFFTEYHPTIGLTTKVFGLSLILSLFTIRLSQTLSQSLFISMCMICWGCMLAMYTSTAIPVSFLQDFIETLRNGVIEKINKTLPHKATQGFALAILLGVKSDMDKSLVNAYTQLGVIHIIAISGMHLEILFSNLKRITQFLPKNKIFKLIELAFLLTTVWLYTFMAFASPSIVRASLLFSIYTVGKWISEKSFALNSIAAGICVALMISKNGLHSIGLQLSYAAVIGIHLLYKPFFKSIQMDNPIVRFMWSNGCMSLAALITTVPILLFHFKQIAAWVLVSNFILIPLSNLILYGLAILLFIPIQFPIAYYWGSLMDGYIAWFNQIIQSWFIQTKAGSIQLTMNLLDIGIYYTIVLFVYCWLLQRNTSWLSGILLLLTANSLLKLFS
jgi:competence protein ComEC